MPLDLLFLGQTPRSARLLGPQNSRLSLTIAYENTFAATDGLISLFEQDNFSNFGGEVTQPILEAVAASLPSGTSFYVDGETIRTVIDAGLGFGSRFEVNLEVPLLTHSGGVMDSFIDSYHDRFGFSDGGRPGFVTDRFAVGYVGDGESVFIEGGSSGIELSDIVISGRAGLLLPRERRPAVTASFSVKLPTGDPDRLAGSGSTDYGVSVELSQVLGRSTLHGGLSYSNVGKWDLAPGLPLTNAGSAYIAYAFEMTSRSHLVGQILGSSGPFESRSGNDLGRSSYEVAIGMRYRNSSGFSFEGALLENLNSDFNAPDVGLFFGITYRPGSGEQPGPRP